MALIFPAPAQIKNLQDPTDPQDAATKAYADTLKVDPTKIANGTSNVAITTLNGNVTVGVSGVDTVLTITGTGTVVKGLQNVSGNLITSGNLLAGLPGANVFLGNTSNIRVYGGTTGQYLKLTNASASTAVTTQVQTTDTTITVTSTTGFPTTGYIIIDSEVIGYTGVTATTFTGCTRGQLNSTIAGHSTTTVVYSYNGGTLGWASVDATQIFNGTSNVSVALNGNVTVGVAGNSGIVTVTGTGVNIAGYANLGSGNLLTTGNANAGNFNATSQFVSTLATGTAPLVVNSTTKVANLYANLADYTAVLVSTTGTYYPTFVSSSAAGGYQHYANANLSFNVATGQLITNSVNVSGQLISTVITGTAPLVVNSNTLVPNLNSATANVSTHLSGGAAGSIHYQTTANTTAILSAGTSGQYLQTTGTGLQWSTIITDKISNGTSNINITSGANIQAVVNNTIIANITSYGIVTTGNLVVNSGTKSFGSSPTISTTQTWANAAYEYTGILQNITDSGSLATSKLIDLQVGGVSKFAVDKAGNIIYTGSFNTPTIATTITSTSQPYITSLGSLTGLTVSNATGVVNFTTTANVTLGAIANLRITGGSSGQILSTNGSGGLSWITPATAPTSFFLGTTNVILSRVSSSFGLTGITSIDGSAASLTTPRLINGVGFNGTADITVTANAQTLTGTSLPVTVLGSNLTSVGTLANLTVGGFSSLQGISEVITSPTVGTYNLATGTLFYHGSGAVTANFTATITNCPAVGAGLSRTVVVSIIVQQGTPPYIINAISINDSLYTIKWFGGYAPSGTPNALDVFSFSIIIISGAVVAVTGNYATYS